MSFCRGCDVCGPIPKKNNPSSCNCRDCEDCCTWDED